MSQHHDKKTLRLKRAARLRFNSKDKDIITVFKSNKHIYAQLITSEHKVAVQASSLEAPIRKLTDSTKTHIAVMVGDLIGKRAKEAGYTQVSFDRSGFKYHGRVKALADAARAQGLKF